MIDMTFSRLGTKLLGGLATLSLAVSPLALHAQTATNTNVLDIPDNVVLLGTSNPNVRTATAVVNGSVITGTDVDQRTALLVSASEGQLPEEELKRVRMQVLRNLIDETLQIQEAAAQEIEVSDAQVEQRYQQLAAQNFGNDPKQMDLYLLRIGSSPASLKRQIKGELAWSSLLRRNISPFVNVSEEEMREKMERMEADKGTDEYRLGEIYLSATAENLQAVQQNASQIVEQLRQGGSFVAYARQFSEASTAPVGGDLGWVRLSRLPAELSAQVSQMQPGELRGPIPIPGGFSILYLIDKRQILTADPRDAKLSLKQISISFSPDVTQQAANTKIENFTKAIATMRGCGDAESVASGIGATVVANDITARQLPEQLQGLLLGLQIGQTTPPFGSVADGVRVLMLCGRDDPEQVGGPSLDQMIAEAEEKRIQQRAQRYLRDLRNDAYIEYN